MIMRKTVFVLSIFLSVTMAGNFDIFKWPSIGSHLKNLGNSGPLEELSRLKSKAFRKLGEGIEELKSKVDDFKSNLFSAVSETVDAIDGGDNQGYEESQPSHYGQSSSSNSNGYFQVAHQAPSTSYGAPEASKKEYGAPQKGYGAPPAPKSAYGAPPAPKSEYGAPPAPKSEYGAPPVPQSGYGAPKRPQTGNGASQEPRGLHGSTGQSSYSSLNAPVKSGVAQERSRFQSKLSAPDPNEVNAPLSAAMAMGNILGKSLSKEGHSFNGQWKPLFFNQTASFSTHRSESGGPDLGDIFKTQNTKPNSGSSTMAELKQEILGLENKGKSLSSFSSGLTLPTQLEVPRNDAKISIIQASDIKDFQNSNTQPSDLFFGKALVFRSTQENIASVDRADDGSFKESKPLVSGEQNHNMMFGSLLEALKLTVFMKLIRKANLDAMLTTAGGFTIFAPSDSAFALLPRSVYAQLENDTDKLREVILFHVVPGRIPLKDIRHELLLSTAAPRARKIRINIYDFGADLQPIVTVNGAKLKVPDMMASNVIVHIIDRVLYPMVDLSIMEHLKSCDIFNGANVAITSSGMTSVLSQEGPFTFFVPSTEAFSHIDNATVTDFLSNLTSLQNVMMFHVVPGTYFSEGLRDNGWLHTLHKNSELQVRVTSDGYMRRISGVGLNTRILKADIIAKNGVLHIIDKVLQPGMEAPLCSHF